MSVAELRSAKGHTDENFPVASVLIAPKHRAAILAFYRFARAADDVADCPTASPDEKLARLGEMAATLEGGRETSPEAGALRRAIADRPQLAVHGQDLLEAFRRDCTKTRYADWAELMDYCRFSAAPVGRFVLGVHGEGERLWPANDALCAALQVINHLQDCGKDYRELDRVYLPEAALAEAGAHTEDLGAARATPALRTVVEGLARRCDGLLEAARPFAGAITDRRLGLEVAVIQRLSEDLNAGLKRRDPLSEPVHHAKPRALGLALSAVVGHLARPRRPSRTAADARMAR